MALTFGLYPIMEAQTRPRVQGKVCVFFRGLLSAFCSNSLHSHLLPFIPIDISCPSGQYLPLGSSSEAQCTNCSPGKFSLGGGTRIEGTGWVNNFRGWGAVSNSQISFRTTCTNTRTGAVPPLTECSKYEFLRIAAFFLLSATDLHISFEQCLSYLFNSGG